MFFADLTPYTYGWWPKPPRKDVLNVGWLSRGQPFTTGTSSDPFARILRRLIASPVFLPVGTATAMGFHGCEFCSPTGADEPPMGTGELWVPSAGGVIYVAPELVAHYVDAHGYLPPQEFIDAVVALREAVGTW